jgi:hypothetical protein
MISPYLLLIIEVEYIISINIDYNGLQEKDHMGSPETFSGAATSCIQKSK